MQFGDICHFKTASGNSQRQLLRWLEPAPGSVLRLWRPDGSAVAEYCAVTCLVGRYQGFFVTAPSITGQCFRHIIALLHFYCDIVAVLCVSELDV